MAGDRREVGNASFGCVVRVACFQFVVVSLKDGMFNNANVLFKTKFVDGVSTVSRHVQRQ